MNGHDQNAPLVSFLMPVASPAPYLGAALQSVVDQTHQPWELVLVVDGPAEDVVATATRLVPAERLRLVELPRRIGIAGALNAGIDEVRGEFIARLDADDVNEPDRLEHQLRLMQSSPGLVVVGSEARLIDANGEPVGALTPPTGDDIRESLSIRNEIVHSSAMVRTAQLRAVGGYNERCVLREDYELWLRLSRDGAVSNVDRPLVSYRLSDGQISRGRAPLRAHYFVARARFGLRNVVPLPLWKLAARQLLWSAGQTKTVQSTRGRLAKLRYPSREETAS